ncbi:hypothetical protein [Halococcus hamelinensis]|uniref:hypothetical protein n=1 Tax=Halococcus hamelinensis TaxID=332168 RepID=UPI000ADEDE01|nr:hypothetical protein [Halococcus hamelinensis]
MLLLVSLLLCYVLVTETIAVNPILVNGQHLSAKANVTTFGDGSDGEPKVDDEDAEAEA